MKDINETLEDIISGNEHAELDEHGESSVPIRFIPDIFKKLEDELGKQARRLGINLTSCTRLFNSFSRRGAHIQGNAFKYRSPGFFDEGFHILAHKTYRRPSEA